MSKMEIEVPEKFIFSTKLSVREIDIAKGLHVSFATILDYVFEAHILFFQHMGFTVTDIEGYSLIFANLSIIYQGEVLYGDELKIEVTVDNFKEKGCDEFFRITKDNGKKEVGLVKIFMLFFDYSTRKTVKIPPSFLESYNEKMNNLPSRTLSSLYSGKNSVWKMAHQFVLEIYNFTKKFPPDEQDNLGIKCRKLAVSLPLYINETTQKKGDPESIKYYRKTVSVIEELKYYLVISHDLELGNSEQLVKKIEEIQEELRSLFQIDR